MLCHLLDSFPAQRTAVLGALPTVEMVVVCNLPKLPKQIQNHEEREGCNMERKMKLDFTRSTRRVVSQTSMGSSKKTVNQPRDNLLIYMTHGS